MITCRECLRALHPFLDRELAADDVLMVEFHLEECAECFTFFEFQQTVMRVIRVKCTERSAPDSLKKKLAQLLQVEVMRQRQPPRQKAL